MTNPPSATATTSGLTWRGKLFRSAWMVASIIATVALVISLVRPHQPPAENPTANASAPPKIARVLAIEHGLIEVAAETPLQKELEKTRVESEKISLPVISVSGTVVARIRAGNEPIEDRWQFDKPDLSSSYADWLRAKNEIDFTESQLSKTKALAEAETSFLQTNLDRFAGLAGGTIPEKEIRQAESALLKAQLQGEKDVFGAESARRVAIKQKTAIERDLAQAGIEPVVFLRAEEDMVIVVAYVPEAKVSEAYEEQACEVQFYAYPEMVFPGHVEAISSVLTQERRTLRVLFDLKDEKQLLKPGMFAEVGLGTDPRESVLIPATALLHLGRNDYVLVATNGDQWRVTEVEVGEVQRGRCEVRKGLKSGETIITRGAILLKSIAAQSLMMPPRITEMP